MHAGSGWSAAAAATLLVTVAAIATVGLADASPQGSGSALPEPLARLEFMVGSWTAESVEFLDEEGQVVRTSRAESRNDAELNGRVVLHAGRLEEPEIATRGWYFWDGGRTWRRTSRQTFRRVGAGGAAQRPAVLDAIDAYTGEWRSEDKTTQQGDTFHFEYELRWIDPGRTIVEMHITQVGPDDTSTVFQGYKGLHPDGGVYYFGVSPSGRGARGEVRLEGDELITLYEGWTATGDVVEIRDVFEPTTEDGDAFVSRTFLRPTPGSDWRQIGRDHWRRTDR